MDFKIYNLYQVISLNRGPTKYTQEHFYHVDTDDTNDGVCCILPRHGDRDHLNKFYIFPTRVIKFWVVILNYTSQQYLKKVKTLGQDYTFLAL